MGTGCENKQKLNACEELIFATFYNKIDNYDNFFKLCLGLLNLSSTLKFKQSLLPFHPKLFYNHKTNYKLTNKTLCDGFINVTQ